MSKFKVLFVCVHNSARSQMAEAYLRRFTEDRVEVSSAGLEPTEVNPLAVEALAEDGIDIAGKPTQSVFKLYQDGRLYDYVITVCEDAKESKCPVFPGVTKRIHWGFPDPDAAPGGHDERLAAFRQTRDKIKDQVRAWADEINAAAHAQD